MPLISQVPQLAPYVERLTNMGLHDTDELYSAAEGNFEALGDYLEADLGSLLRYLNLAPPPVPQAIKSELERSQFQLGVPLEHFQLASKAFAVTAPALGPQPSWPRTVNLISQMPPVKDQGKRETCVAFATLSGFEHKLQCRQDFAEQFLYWNCKQNDNTALPGSYLFVAVPLMIRDGCCLEDTWPYNSQKTHGIDDQPPPPAGARPEGLKYRASSFKQLPPTSVNDIKAELVAGRPVAFTVPVFASWKSSLQVQYSGNITNPVPGESRLGGHAMTFVGFEDQPSALAWGGGRFIIRNSWGATWGSGCSFAAGHGLIPYSYIARYGSEAFSIQ